MDNSKEVARAMKIWFEDNGYTLARVAEMFGSSAQSVSNSLSGDRFLGRNLARKYSETFGFNPTYLMTGEGSLLGDKPAPDDGAILRGKVIPFFDAEAAAGNQYGMDMTPRASPLALIEIGNVLADSELAVRVYGNSMVPNYPAGCVIGVKETHETFIVPGSVYVVETGENRYLKRLYYAAGKDALRCVSDNTMTHESGPMRGEYVYPDFEIPLKEVKRLWQVVGVIKRNLI